MDEPYVNVRKVKQPAIGSRAGLTNLAPKGRQQQLDEAIDANVDAV